jgi:hypothetical protein
MDWTIIKSPVDMPPDCKAVLVSDDHTTGVGYHRQDKMGIFREDGWVLIWPVDPDNTFNVTKWTELPKP